MFVINCCFFPLYSFSKATKYISPSCSSSCPSTTFCHYTLSVLLTLFCTQNELFVGMRLISMKKKGKSLILITYLIPWSLKRLQAVACFSSKLLGWTHLQPTRNNVVNPGRKRRDCFKSQGEWWHELCFPCTIRSYNWLCLEHSLIKIVKISNLYQKIIWQ